MVRIQNESLSAQIQILQNNVQAIFFLRDASYEGTEYMNAFHEAVVQAVESLQGLLVELENGQYVLTEFGQGIQDIAVTGVENMVVLMRDLTEIIQRFTEEGLGSVDMIRVLFVPLQALLKIVEFLGPEFLKLYMTYRLINAVLPIQLLLTTSLTVATMMYASTKAGENLIQKESVRLSISEAMWLEITEKITWQKLSLIHI